MVAMNLPSQDVLKVVYSCCKGVVREAKVSNK